MPEIQGDCCKWSDPEHRGKRIYQMRTDIKVLINNHSLERGWDFFFMQLREVHWPGLLGGLSLVVFEWTLGRQLPVLRLKIPYFPLK